MPALVTNKFRIHNAKQFVEAFDEVSFTSGTSVTDSSGLLNTNMYLFIGKVTSWDDDQTPPTPTDAVANTHYENWRDMIAAKKITSSDVSHAIPRKNWTNNTSYFAYTHNAATLFSQDYYVMTDDYNVYKCLANSDTTSTGAEGTTSTVKPTGTGTSIISTADGYKWKFMYQISAADALKFVTPNYIPVDTVRRSNGFLANTFDNSPGQNQYDVEVTAAASGNGAIEVVHMTNRGLKYLGEVLIKGPNITPGYWNNEEATKNSFVDGWLKTGDAAQMDDEGFIYIVDRQKDMYISGGENVYPAEIENVLYQLPQIAEAAIIGIPDEKWGEVGLAFIALKPNENLSDEDIINHCLKNLAKFKIPKTVKFIEALPRNATGKVLKRTLREQKLGKSAPAIS